MKKSRLSLLLFAGISTAYADIQSVTAISEPTGTGQKVTAVELKYTAAPVNVEPSQFAVEGRTITSAQADATGVRLTLSADDANSGVTMQPAPRQPSVERDTTLTVKQLVPLKDEHGKTVPTFEKQSEKTVNLVADDFRQLEFKDANGVVVKYNLFVPKNYDPKKSYPLVMFIHDAGATNNNVKNTLWQGNGATVWASSEWQAKHPSFVLAPQFDHVIVNDKSDDPADLDATINLIKSLSKEYSIDTKRLYATGQSGGAMMSIAMNIKYPDFFAASYIVAGQWAAEKTAPMAKNKFFILVSEDDPKAYPGQNAIVDVLAKHGAVVQKAVLTNGNATEAEHNAEVKALLAKEGNVHYMAVRSKTLPDQVNGINATSPGQAHIGTWKISYNINAICEWLFAQSK